jgi:recombination protein RecA
MTHNSKKINSKNNRAGKLSKDDANKLDLTPLQREVLYGTLLGDGSLKPHYGKYKNSFFQMRHGITQEEWFNWKAEQLYSISTDKATHVQKPDGYSSKEKSHFKSRALPCLTRLEQEVNTNGEKDFTKPWLFNLTETSLMVWYLDDGGLMGRNGKLSTQGFGKDGALYLISYLLKKWDLPGTLRSQVLQGKRYWFIQLSPKPLKRFLELIMPLIPCEFMVYKTFLKYKNSKMQQDWITTMKKHMPRFVDEIDRLAKKAVVEAAASLEAKNKRRAKRLKRRSTRKRKSEIFI